MARKKLNRNQRERKRQEKRKEINLICLETIDSIGVKTYKSGLPVTPTGEEKFDFPTTNICPNIGATKSTEEFLKNLEAEAVKLFG